MTTLEPSNLNKKGLVLSYIPALYRAAFSEEVPLKKYGCAKIKDLVAYLLSEVTHLNLSMWRYFMTLRK